MSGVLAVLEGFNHYKDQQITRVDAGALGIQSWNVHPVSLTPAEMAVVNFDFAHVIEVINGRTKSPSQLANLQPQELCDTARRMDLAYQAARAHYTALLIQATNEDLKKQQAAEYELRHAHLQTGAIATFPGAGMGAGIGTAVGAIGGPPGMALGAGIGAGIGAIVGFIVGLVGGNHGRKLYVVHVSSANRVKALHDIDTLEKERIVFWKQELQQQIATLAQNILEGKQANLVNPKDQHDHDQLKLILNFV